MTRVFACAWLLLLASAAAAEDWELRESENGVEVYTRPVEGSSFRAFRGSAEIPGSVDAVLAVLRDAESYPTWFPDCPSAELLERSDDEQLHWAEMSAPWPVAHRDAIYHYAVQHDDASGVTRIVVGVRPDARPDRDGMVRVRAAEGSWTLEPVGPDVTRATWEMHLEPGGGIPAWLSNARIVDTPQRTLRGLREQVVAQGS